MKIETKFDIGQEVFFMFNNKVRSEEIEKIRVIVDRKNKCFATTETHACYWLKSWSNDTDFFSEEKLFASKEELLASL